MNFLFEWHLKEGVQKIAEMTPELQSAWKKDDYNKIDLRVIGPKITLHLNGKLAHEVVSPRLSARGEIGWLVPPKYAELRVRNIQFQELQAEAVGKEWQSLFNGKDLEGWQGAVDNYEVKDGAIVCKPGKGGNLLTKEEYADFQARVEFKLPPGGNNGLAIRYPGTGDTAYTGMCELQVLDDNYDKVKGKIDVRQDACRHPV